MKSATLPSIRVEPAFRAEVETLLAEGETLSEFLEGAIRAGVQRRHINAEFIGKGLRARDQARRKDDCVDADTVLRQLEEKLDAARRRASTGRK